MTLRAKQSLFARLVAALIARAYTLGYEVTLGEAWRTPEQAALNAKKGIGIKNSVHIVRLAIDLNLFKNGSWLKASEQYQPLGEWWEQQNELCRWGGRFGDGNHFSFEHEGRA